MHGMLAAMLTQRLPPGAEPGSPAAGSFSALFEFLPIGAYRSSPGGVQLRANAALVRLNGYDNEAQMLASVNDIATEWYVDPARRAQFLSELEQHGHVRGFVSEVHRHRTRERIWISENAYSVHDAAGQLLYFEGTVEEITERVQAQAALQRSEAQLRQIADHVPGMVYRLHVRPDAPPHYSFVSRGVRQVYGVEPEAVLADGGILRRFRHPQDHERVDRETAYAGQHGLPLAIEFRIVIGSGEVRWVQMSSSAAMPEGAEQVRVGVMLDITAHRQAEAMRGERDQAEAAQRAMTQFLSKVSHELRTPLNAILGFSQLMQMDAQTHERHRAWLAEVLASGRHLLGLVDDILDLSGAQSGLMAVEIADVELAPVVQECRAMLAAQASDMQLRWSDTMQAETQGQPRLWVRADRKRLKQVVSNLLSNAIKYNRIGGDLTLTATHSGPRVSLSIGDSGSGMDAEQLGLLFNPFERLGAQRTRVPGTGLGLALSRQLVEAMGGEINVHSRPGEGSTFTVSLPASSART